MTSARAENLQACGDQAGPSMEGSVEYEGELELSWDDGEGFSGPQVAGPDPSSSLEASTDILSDVYADPVVTDLCDGLLAKMLPSAEKAQAQLTELTNCQRVLIETVQGENKKFEESEALAVMDSMYARTQLYMAKLQKIKRQMTSVHDRSTKVKRRATKLQEQVQKSRLQAEVDRDKQIDHDRKLQPVIRRPSGDDKSRPV